MFIVSLILFVGGMLLSPICSLLVIPTFARIFMPYVPSSEIDTPAPDAPTHVVSQK